MRNSIMKKFLAFVLTLTLVITMAPMMPGASAKAYAEGELLPAPAVTIDKNGVVTWTEVEGADRYSWMASTFGGFASEKTVDLYESCVYYGKDSGTYTFSVYAVDSGNTQISEAATVTYDFTSPHTHVWDMDSWTNDATHHWHECTAEGCRLSNTGKPGFAAHEYFAGVCICGKTQDVAELKAAPVITIDEDGVATWTEVEGASYYLVACSTFGGYISGTSYDVAGKLADKGKGPGMYTLTVQAVDSDRNKVSEVATATYDTRNVADAFTGTSSITAPVYGEEVTTVYDFEFTGEVNACVPESMGIWYIKAGDTWEKYEGTVFKEGTYYYSNQLRLDSSSGTGETHRLPADKEISITINGEKWTHDEPWIDKTYSYVYINSPEFVVVTTDLELDFKENSNFNINTLYQNRAIEPYSVADAVVGGEGPYTFSKTSGPAWLAVSSDGIISGTPDEIGPNENLVVRVTDNAGTYKEITISVGNTSMNPNDRIDASTFVAASDIKAPVYGETVTRVYDFDFTSEVNARVPGSMGYWYKIVDGNWVVYTASVFDTGVYYYSNQIRLDSTSRTGSTHKLTDALDITINGEKWTHDEVYVFDTYSYAYMKSPVYIVKRPLPENITIAQASCIYDGKIKTPEVTVGNLTKDVDYTVSYSNNKNIGTATVTIKGIGDYEGTVTKTFKIKARDLAAPSKVNVTLYGYDDVKVSWSKVSGASGYYVYCKKSTASSYTYLGRTTGTTYKKPNLTDGAKYTFRVYPYVKDGVTRYRDSSYKTSAGIYTLKQVTNVKAVKSGSKVKVSWSNINGETGYQISRSASRSKTNIVATYKTATGKSKLVTATKGKTYYYKVRAYKTVTENGVTKKVYGPWSKVKAYKR